MFSLVNHQVLDMYPRHWLLPAPHPPAAAEVERKEDALDLKEEEEKQVFSKY